MHAYMHRSKEVYVTAHVYQGTNAMVRGQPHLPAYLKQVLMFAVMWDRLAIPQASLRSLVSPQGPWYYRCTQWHLEWDGCQESEFRSSQLSGKRSTHRGSSPALPVSTHWPCSPRSQYSSLFPLLHPLPLITFVPLWISHFMSLENLEPTHERKDTEFALLRPPSFAQYSNLQL